MSVTKRILFASLAASLAAWGQVRSGAHAGNGHSAAIHAAPAPARASQAPGPNLGGTPYPIRTDIAPPTGLIPPAAAYTGIAPGGLNVVGGGARRVEGRGRGSAPYFYGAGYPYLGSFGEGYFTGAGLDPRDSFPSYGETVPAAREPGGNVDTAPASGALAQQIQGLSEQLQQMQIRGLASQPDPAATSAQDNIPITVILKDGHRVSTHSFAVMNGVLWDFSGQRPRKIPVNSINVAASEQATTGAGAEFPSLNQTP